ncbi:MAG: hypothetical protein NVS3B20_12120 [Polyangiales bacterium]
MSVVLSQHRSAFSQTLGLGSLFSAIGTTAKDEAFATGTVLALVLAPLLVEEVARSVLCRGSVARVQPKMDAAASRQRARQSLPLGFDFVRPLPSPMLLSRELSSLCALISFS